MNILKLLIMIIHCCVLLVVVVSAAGADPGYDCDYCQPEQIHIAFGEKSNDIVVTWSTFNDTQDSVVEYGVGSMSLTATGASKLFVDGGKLRRSQYIHSVTLKDLLYNTTYVYHCGSVFGWSEPLSLRTPPAGDAWPLRAAVYGDMGNKNAHSLSYLQEESERGAFDVIVHVGDFAYDMDTDDALVGDQFMRQIQPLAASVPYMTCPGNHEEAYNFSNYKARFPMPGGSEGMFYSWDLARVHFVSISTEFYYFTHYGYKQLVNQFDWLRRDLTEANLPENRARRPWIVLYGHRPMYCSNSDDKDCSFEYTRRGLPILGLFALEPLLLEFGVDLVVWAHEHSYERTWPLYDGEVRNGSLAEPYLNARAPVHVVTGSAGCQEDTDKFNPHPQPWSAFRSTDYGYSRLAVPNATHLHFEQVSVDLKGQVVDSFWLSKTRREPAWLAPVHLVTGSAGCQEGRDHFRRTPFHWSAFRSQDFGYTRLKFYNHTHLQVEQVSVDLDGQVVDGMWLVKTNSTS